MILVITDNTEEKVLEGVQIKCKCGKKRKGTQALPSTGLDNVDMCTLIQVLHCVTRSRGNTTLEV